MASNALTPLSATQAAHELEIDKRWVEQVSARHTQSSMWLIGTLRDRVMVLAEAGKAGGTGTTDDQERSFAKAKAKAEVDRLTRAVTLFGLLAVLSWLAGVVAVAQVPSAADEVPPVQRVILECAPGACPK